MWSVFFISKIFVYPACPHRYRPVPHLNIALSRQVIIGNQLGLRSCSEKINRLCMLFTCTPKTKTNKLNVTWMEMVGPWYTLNFVVLILFSVSLISLMLQNHENLNPMKMIFNMAWIEIITKAKKKKNKKKKNKTKQNKNSEFKFQWKIQNAKTEN